MYPSIGKRRRMYVKQFHNQDNIRLDADVPAMGENFPPYKTLFFERSNVSHKLLISPQSRVPSIAP